MKSAFKFLFSSTTASQERETSSINTTNSTSTSSVFSIFTSNRRIFSRAPKNASPPPLPSSSPDATGFSPTTRKPAFIGLPSVAEMLRATEVVTSVAVVCGTKRRREPEEDLHQASISSADSATSSRVSKRRRTGSDHSPFSLEKIHVKLVPTSTFSPPTPSSTSPPPPQAYRLGVEPLALGLWISELVNDRFCASLPVEKERRFLNKVSEKHLSDWVIAVLEALDPSNHMIFLALIYFERLMRSASLNCGDCQIERFVLAKRTFMMSLHLSFIWLDDAPWTLSSIAEWMDLSLSEATRWELEALVLLNYNLTISPDMWFSWLDALGEHANNGGYHADIASAISDMIYDVREDVRETKVMTENYLAAVRPPAPTPPLVAPPSPKPETSLQSLADELEPYRARVHTPYPGVIPDIPDEDEESYSPESCYSTESSEDFQSQSHRRREFYEITVPAARSTALEQEAWDWYEEGSEVLPVVQPQPVYPSYQFYLLSAAA
ncbi:hypothetical protein V5O48_009053 [Marasmius crinis-equi]|uniref:Cyclin N-terminal domain-containing protein n=1 Tax=Marasmius crinis-equi TaxID=585013 RepID=A0ABR3FC51_9AGAR